MFYFSDRTNCPLCGTEKLKRLTKRDGIDRLYWNLFRIVCRVCDVHLYHCRYCRIQFYDILRARNTLSTASSDS